jgi:CRP-like cAMP-binding protein
LSAQRPRATALADAEVRLIWLSPHKDLIPKVEGDFSLRPHIWAEISDSHHRETAPSDGMMSLERSGPEMNAAIHERTHLQPDSTAFVAEPDLLRALESRATPVWCRTERLLFNQDEPAVGVYIIREGCATLAMHSFDGRPIFSIEALPGSLLGLPALISDQPYSLTAIAHAGAKVSFVGRSEFFAIMQADPLLSLKMLKVLAAEVRTARESLQ